MTGKVEEEKEEDKKKRKGEVAGEEAKDEELGNITKKILVIYSYNLIPLEILRTQSSIFTSNFHRIPGRTRNTLRRTENRNGFQGWATPKTSCSS